MQTMIFCCNARIKERTEAVIQNKNTWGDRREVNPTCRDALLLLIEDDRDAPIVASLFFDLSDAYLANFTR